MNILIAPNSIKNAANALEIADAMEEGFSRADPGVGIQKMPLADGGEYSLEILLQSLGGEMVFIDTFDPIGRPICAAYGITEKNEAIIELPKASGYELLKENERNPLYTSTYGTGLQIRDAMERGVRNIILTLGGSSSVDGGTGILEALGIRFRDAKGETLPRGGGNLLILDHIDATAIMPEASETKFTILCDVTNPLLGASGAAMTFAPQKGAGPMETMVLERCLARFGEKCENYSGKKLINLKGAGAAGGVAVGLTAFFHTKILPGTEFILKIQKADKNIQWADVVITAAGDLSSQTFGGKAPAVLAKKAKGEGKKVICIAGFVPLRAEHPDPLFDAVFSLQNRPMTMDESIDCTLENFRNISFEIGRLIKV